MKVGTKSILFGAHCLLIHPWFVFFAWWKLYGFPWDPRFWVAFFVHDLGYWGKPNMDGKEGKTHVELGAKIMQRLFDPLKLEYKFRIHGCPVKGTVVYSNYWHDFTLYHSRFYAKEYGIEPSKLCFADKLAICYEPSWCYLLRANLSGEINEYMEHTRESRIREGKPPLSNQWDWCRWIKDCMRSYVQEHRDGKEDTWTPERKRDEGQLHEIWK